MSFLVPTAPTSHPPEESGGGDALAVPAASSFAYVDTPDFRYDGWLAHNEPRGAIGRAEGDVLVIGGGVSGTAAAYELSRAGCRVTLVEAEPALGGRCASRRFKDEPPRSPNLVELGAMRFTESLFVMSYYLDRFGHVRGGIGALPLFPDPGVVVTWLCDADGVVRWDGQDAPQGFETVYYGWHALATNGIRRSDGAQAFMAPMDLRRLLQRSASGDGGALAAATAAWQAYITAFQGRSFYGVLHELFTGAGPYEIPGGQPWAFDDFDKFGTIGVGSGGFGALYSVGFLEIYRLIINGLEEDQRILRPGVRILPEELVARAGLAALVKNTQVTRIHGSLQEGFRVEYEGEPTDALTDVTFDRIVFAATTRAMEITTNLTSDAALLDARVATAVRRVHVASSAKVAIRIRKFWEDGDDTPRVLLCDNVVRQIYTLDYGAQDGTAVAFITYVWDEDATKQQGLGASSENYGVDKVKLYQNLYAKLLTYAERSPELAAWIAHIVPYTRGSANPGDFADSILYVEWQSQPHFNGAFKLSYPGQDRYVQTMFFDYLKADPDSPAADTGVYIAGDCIAYTSGWVDGALQTGLNAAAAVLTSTGTLYGDAHGQSPMTINKDRFDYFPVPVASTTKAFRTAAASTTKAVNGPGDE